MNCAVPWWTSLPGRWPIVVTVFALMACGGGNSAGGSKIAFYSSLKLDGTDAQNANGTYNIWRVNADGTGLTPLTSATAVGAGSGAPQWSPDGSRVVFLSSRKLDGTDAQNGTDNIWRVNADGTGLRPITNATFVSSFYPQWSPDGSKVVFYSSRKLDGTDAPGTSNIWRVNATARDLPRSPVPLAQGRLSRNGHLTAPRLFSRPPATSTGPTRLAPPTSGA